MAKGFDLSFIEQLKNKNDIVDVISKYVTLERRGGNYWARCPFHHEKTPSFSVNENGQYYHCFGCGKGGDVISFVKEIESLEYIDTVKFLAERAKIPMPDVNYNDEELKKQRQKKERMLSILTDTAKFYSANLRGESATEFVQYIFDRGLSSKTAAKFGLGASLNFDGLVTFLLSKGYAKEELLEAGVCSEKDGHMFDSLGGRLIFPIINAFGDVIAFGGRQMQKTDFAKYKNTSETKIFQKSKNLYNINLLKKAKQETGISDVIMVEGYMDTIALYQAGFKNVVASMGTSLTKDQARLIKRYSDTVIISYDGDAAGAKATIRGLEILENENVTVRVASMPDGLDPDDVVKQYGREGYQRLLDEALPLIDYKLLVLKKSYDLSKPEEKRRYTNEAIGVIKTVKSASLQEELLKSLRDVTDITYESLKKQLDSTEVTLPEITAIEVKTEKAGYITEAMRFILASLLFDKRYADGFDIKSLKFDNNVHNEIVNYIILQKNSGNAVKVSMLYELFDEEDDKSELNSILGVGLEEIIDSEQGKRYFNDCVNAVRAKNLDEEIEALSKMGDAETDISQKKVIAEKLKEKITERIKLK